MTNTYQDDANPKEKLIEELRCIRCALERLLRVLDEGKFVDYQFEKFGKKDAEFLSIPRLGVLQLPPDDITKACFYNWSDSGHIVCEKKDCKCPCHVFGE